MKHAQRCSIVETFIDLPQPCQRFFVISKNLIRQNDDSRDAQHTAGFFDGELFSARFSVFQVRGEIMISEISENVRPFSFK